MVALTECRCSVHDGAPRIGGSDPFSTVEVSVPNPSHGAGMQSRRRNCTQWHHRLGALEFH